MRPHHSQQGQRETFRSTPGFGNGCHRGVMEIPRGLVFSADTELLRDVVAAHRDTCTEVGHTRLHKRRQDENKCENGKRKMQKTVTLR